MKRTFALALSILMLASVCLFTGCAETKKDTFTVGICQLVQHPALDSATRGFREALVQELGDKVTFDEQNASGEIPNCSTIINGFVSKKVDLIMANATGALQTAVAATTSIPVLGTSVTAYGVALDIEDFNGTVGGNVSGTSDLVDFDAQVAMTKEWFPDAKTVGLVFCSAEANSRYQVDEMTKRLNAAGYTCKSYSFTDSNDLSAVVRNACDNSDILYVPTDNACANNTETIRNIILEKKTPVVAGEEGICGGCGCCTLSISYYDLGFTTGLMAAKILKGEAKISEMAVEYAPATKKYNAELCAELGITPVAGYAEIQ